MFDAKVKKTWLITGCAGFIGSNILEFLLINNQKVVGLDNFATGYQRNLDEVKSIVGLDRWVNFTFIKGDIRDKEICNIATKGIDIVLHQAALGSVPRSIVDPLTTNDINVGGTVNMLKACVDNKVRRFIYASSSSVYGDSLDVPKVEVKLGDQLSPYAVAKYCCELYANVFAKNYGLEVIGLRYFNVFGKYQDPNGAYAAVIPLWFKAVLNNESPVINGDGETSRDFCYIDNVVQMNVLCGLTANKDAFSRVYNVAFNEQTTLNLLFNYIKDIVATHSRITPIYREFRDGDIRHSLADISLARQLIGYNPVYNVVDGLNVVAKWYQEFFKPNREMR